MFGPTDHLIVSDDRPIVVHDHLIMRSCDLVCRSDAPIDASDHLIASGDADAAWCDSFVR